MNNPGTWSFNWDRGLTPINAVWHWIQWFFYFPGDGLLYLVIHRTPQIADYFDITISSYGGTLSTIASLSFWISLGIVLMVAKK